MKFDDPNNAFLNAIDSKVLSDKPGDGNYAGNYMYMHSTTDADFFKNIDTRKYIEVKRKELLWRTK